MSIKKIYVNSKHRTLDSNNSCDFTIDLKQTIVCPNEGSNMYISDVMIPNTILTINNRNNKLYFRVFDKEDNSIFDDYIITLEARMYNPDSFIRELEQKIKENTFINSFVIYNINTYEITISLEDDQPFQIITDYEFLKNIGWKTDINLNDIGSCNPVITNYKQKNIGVIYTSQLNLLQIKDLYLHSNTLSSYSTLMTSNNSNNVLVKIPVVSGPGSIIYYNHISNYDLLRTDGLIFSQIDFKLTDVDLNIIDIGELDISFSIIFVN